MNLCLSDFDARSYNFNGLHDQTEDKDRLKKIQCIFMYMKLEDHEKVTYAINQLAKEVLC